MLDKFIALLLIVILLPLMVIISLVIIIVDGWPFWFVQQRVGKQGKVFWIWKYRTMKIGAENFQNQYKELNEANGPVFKIYNDPRLTRVGKFLYHTGLDEMLQLFNVLRGEMAMVGPRPLPIDEELKISEKYRYVRRKILPGIVSPWIVDGYHNLTFDKWMKSDLEYVKKKNFTTDNYLVIRICFLVFKLIIREIKSRL